MRYNPEVLEIASEKTGEIMLDIRLLGAPLVYWDGELLTIKRRATRALFFYLTTNKEPIERAKLCDFLWADKGGEKEQRQKLRVTLNNLRKAVPNKEVIRTYHDMVGVVPHNLRVDVWEFEATFEKLRRYISLLSEGPTLPPGLYQHLVRSAKLWRSSIFIANGDMQVSSVSENWWLEKNRAFDKDKLILYKFISRQESLMLRCKEAIFWAEKAISIDDYDAEAHFLLLRSLLYSKRQKEGLEYYLSIKDIFSEEWGGAFAKRIHELGQKFVREGQVSPKQARPEWAIRNSAHLPFVGQEDALRKVKENYRRGKVSLILGEAGAGKTRLVQEVYQSLGIKPELLLVTCHLADENIPYQPLVEMLRNSVEEEFWKKLPAIWIQPIAMLLPELRDLREDLHDHSRTSYAKSVLFDAIKNVLNLIAKKRPYLFFVDDIQWADSATLILLAYLLKQSTFETQNMRLIITSRIEEQNPEFINFFLPSSMPTLKKVEIRRLNEENIADLAFYLLQEELSPTASANLLRETGGNPFFVLEILTAIWALPERGNLEGDLPVPASIKSLIERRLENISDSAEELLYIAAILGNPFEFNLLEKAADFSLDEISFLMEELEDAQLLREEKKKDVLKYAFVHEKIRETILSSLTPIQSRLLHKKIAHALEKMSQEFKDAEAPILAKHYEKAGELKRAFELWVQAGQYAYQLFSVEDSVIAYKHAESLMEKTTLTEENIYTLYANWGFMLFEKDNPNALEKVMLRFLAIAEKRGSALLTGAALDGMGDVCMARNQFVEGLAYAKEALAYLKTSNHIPAQMNALIHRGVFLYMLSEFTVSQESFQEALALGKGRNDSASLYLSGHANYQMATVLTGMGFPKKALVYAKKSLHAMRLARSPYGAILPHSISGLAHYYLGNYKEGKEASCKSIALATQTDSWRMMGYASAYAGMNETKLAFLGSAWEYGQKAIRLGEEYEHTEITSMGYKIIGDIYTYLDAYPQAVGAYQKGVDVDPGSFAMLENLAQLGVTLGLLGDSQADATLQLAITKAEKAGLEIISINAKSLELSLFVFAEKYEKFEKNALYIIKEFNKRTHPKATSWIDYLRARSYLQRGDIEKSLVLFENYFNNFEDSPFFWINLRTLKIYITALKSQGRDTSEPRAKLEIMLKKIESGLGEAPLRKEWEKFAKNAWVGAEGPPPLLAKNITP